MRLFGLPGEGMGVVWQWAPKSSTRLTLPTTCAGATTAISNALWERFTATCARVIVCKVRGVRGPKEQNWVCRCVGG